MKKESSFFGKTKCKVLGIILILAMLCALVYFCFFKTMVFVEDQTFDLLYPKKALYEFRTNLLYKGIRLKTVKLDASKLDYPENYRKELLKLKNAKYVVLSPVASLAYRYYSFDSSQLFEKANVIALGSPVDSCFDTALKTDELMLFASAPEDVKVVDNSAINDFSFPAEGSFAVDYRYSQAVPSSSLKGVFAPDLSLSVIPLLDIEKAELPKSGILVYNYYEI